MSVHIGAKKGDIAETVLLPGDPLRAQFVAENYLENPVKYNEVRGMYGFTGTYKGKKISVQGTGMGMPSHSIYVNELIMEYGCKNLIRIGSCGSLQKDIGLREIIFAMASSSNSSYNQINFKGMAFAPTADFGLFMKACDVAKEKGINFHAGNILSSDYFYDEDPEAWKLWQKFGVLAVEMETAALYTLAARHKVNALSILTVSDNLETGELTTSEERQKTFREMMEIALELA